MAEQVLDAITQSGDLLENANIGTTETMMEAGGLAVVGGTVVAGSILDDQAKKKLSTKIHPSETNEQNKKQKKQRTHIDLIIHFILQEFNIML